MEGVVKWFNERKGFGFITVSGIGDVFVHYSSILGNGYKVLYENQKVRLSLVKGDNGYYAKDVEPLREIYIEKENL